MPQSYQCRKTVTFDIQAIGEGPPATVQRPCPRGCADKVKTVVLVHTKDCVNKARIDARTIRRNPEDRISVRAQRRLIVAIQYVRFTPGIPGNTMCRTVRPDG